MNNQDFYERWRQTRAAEAPPAGFADAVMARLHDAERTTQLAGRMLVIAWLAKRQRSLALAAAGAAFLVRLAAAFSLFATH
jgi:hypothetical protein